MLFFSEARRSVLSVASAMTRQDVVMLQEMSVEGLTAPIPKLCQSVPIAPIGPAAWT
jgi:hypothetical protein